MYHRNLTAYLSFTTPKAINLFTKGIEKHPNDPRFYRHRGHRYISTRQYEKAVNHLLKASNTTRCSIDDKRALSK